MTTTTRFVKLFLSLQIRQIFNDQNISHLVTSSLLSFDLATLNRIAILRIKIVLINRSTSILIIAINREQKTSTIQIKNTQIIVKQLRRQLSRDRLLKSCHHSLRNLHYLRKISETRTIRSMIAEIKMSITFFAQNIKIKVNQISDQDLFRSTLMQTIAIDNLNLQQLTSTRVTKLEIRNRKIVNMQLMRRRNQNKNREYTMKKSDISQRIRVRRRTVLSVM